MKSITEDTHESQGSEVSEGSADGGLRARLERYEQSAGGGIRVPEDDSRRVVLAGPVPAGRADEPVSPELVLVDPELADRARSGLPEPRPFTPPAQVAVLSEPVVVDKAPEPELPSPVARPARKRRRAAYALGLLVLAAAAAALVYAALGGFSSSSTDESGAPSPVNEPAANPPPAEAPPVTKPPAAPAGAPRTFSWAPVRGAKWYLVQFSRGSTEIFRARPKEARVVVPAHWSYRGHRLTLQPGRYAWSVRPRLGQHYGKPIVLSQLVIQRSSSGGGQSTRNP